jgi:hypothetical protein
MLEMARATHDAPISTDLLVERERDFLGPAAAVGVQQFAHSVAVCRDHPSILFPPTGFQTVSAPWTALVARVHRDL